ncbi:unnamed protein product [Blepharisma stoltei]|uniref:B box-type domain-containing protein n=1 Tax=Blepharisma stoltei TaxID=1481888 RepID=A0AAU9JY65_9CILI|nr:unnamed protein product [Blepharisma stoltei]
MCEENKATDFCREHNREIGLFCKIDHHLLCFNCVVQHSAHEILLLNDGYVEEVINKKKVEINEAEGKFKEKIDFCEKNLETIKGDRAKIEGLIDFHIKAYENAQKELIEVFGRASDALRESFNNKYKSIFERNQKLIENYSDFTAEFKKKKENLEKLAKDFNSMTISDKINCEISRLDEEMVFPDIENVEDIVKTLEEPINYKGEILEKFNEYFK